MLLDALKEENHQGQENEEITRTLNDISTQCTSHVVQPPAPATTTPSRKSSIAKTDKDKFNAKERRNSRYYVRTGDKEAIQCRANSLKRAINTVMEQSGLYDHKPKHGNRKPSLANLNIPTSLGSADLASPRTSPVQPPPPINIISPTTSETCLFPVDSVADVISSLSPLPDQRRASMDEYFFNSLNLPVPKQFADASRRSSGVQESIKEEESNGASDTDDINSQETNTLKYESSSETEYKYDVGYLGLTSDSDGLDCVPFEVYERNLLRSTQQNAIEVVQETSESVDSVKTPPTVNVVITEGGMLQVPVMSMSEMESMERGPISQELGENVYEGERMTIIDTDPPVSDRNLTSEFD